MECLNFELSMIALQGQTKWFHEFTDQMFPIPGSFSRQRDQERSSTHWFTPQMPVTTRARPGKVRGQRLHLGQLCIWIIIHLPRHINRKLTTSTAGTPSRLPHTEWGSPRHSHKVLIDSTFKKLHSEVLGSSENFTGTQVHHNRHELIS